MAMYCQKCRTPLKLDKSLEELNPAAFDLLVGMLTSSLESCSAVSDKFRFDRKGTI
jgi:beclin 1